MHYFAQYTPHSTYASTPFCPTCGNMMTPVTPVRVSGQQPVGGFACVGCEAAGPNRLACGSGWTNDRCTKKLGHRGPHSNE